MDVTLRRKQSFLLRLPPTLREQAASIAQEEGISLNHFIGLALAEKVSRMQQRSADGLMSLRLPSTPATTPGVALRTGTGRPATPYMVPRGQAGPPR
ncbi:HicB family protein [Bryocella elongata]|uniref:HicB family protein n=2 Tax=Bryocella elongata TaxID=863522 RepID=A0A1H6A2M7_9BACT|nr:HicB family protein [Bryocella elongata]